ncbi:MAG: hypothetical protein KDJ29_03720 [Hyphomicrobiales bacterium]|nr:hypothetical protein [Hyphomicrobiales bacterium]
MLFVPPPVIASAANVAVTYTGHAESATQTASYSFTSQPIGAAAADRYVIFCVMARGVFSGGVNSATLNGNSCTKVATHDAAFGHVQIWITNAPVTSGSTATIVISSSSGDLSACGIDIYSVRGLLSTTPTDTDDNETDNTTLNLSVAEGGFVIACSSQASGATCTVTGAAEVSDRQIRSGNLNGASAYGTTYGATAAVKFDWTSSSNVRAVAASFR